VKGASQGFDVSTQSVDLRTLKVTALKAGHSVLAHVQACGQLNLSELGSLTQFAELVGADLVEHASLVGVYRSSLDRAPLHDIAHPLCHYVPS
jgi:hypothetical protein